MKIRLVMPICKQPNHQKCIDAKNICERLHALQYIMNGSSDIDLVITSHNYFDFSGKHLEADYIPKLLNKMHSRIPLIIGFDTCVNLNPNPFSGVDGVVGFFDVINNNYELVTCIWECWKEEGRCDSKKCFDRQNKQRYFSFKDITIGLLSCGDIYACCNKYQGTSLLNHVCLYVCLFHMSYPKGWTEKSVKNNALKYCDYLVISQQFANENVSIYFHNKSYISIFNNTSATKPTQNVHNLAINNNKYILVDFFV